MAETNFTHIKYAYIIGIGRSGTNLLSSLFNRHRNCLVSPEVEFLIFFHHRFSERTNLNEADYKLICEFFDAFSVKHPLLKLILDTKKLYADLCASGIMDYSTLTRFIHLRFNFSGKPVEEINLILEKNLSYTLHTDKLIRFSPEARFIYMVRDYRANVLSRKQSVEYRSPNTAYNCYRWLLFNRRAYRNIQKKDRRFMLMRYEDLVTATDKELAKACDFLGLSKSPADLTYYSGEGENVLNGNLKEVKEMNERYNKMFSDLEKPVFTDRMEKWKTELPEKDLKIAEAICGTFAMRFGYQKIRNVSAMENFRIRLKSTRYRIRAMYDFYKEFLLYYISPEVKLKRINKLNKTLPKI